MFRQGKRPARGQAELFPGDVLGKKYRLVNRLGEGGMATVWVAENVALDVKVAVKVLRSSYIADARLVARLRREARATASISHKNIVQVFDYGVTNYGAPYIVMELLRGETLADRLRSRGRLPAAEAVHLVARAMKGVTVAHAKGVLHRDLKPENIFLAIEDNGSERPKVLDFGVSFIVADGASQAITQTGAIVGTPAYLPPEVIVEERSADARGDVWALGVMLYETIAGQLPFNGNSYHALVEAVAREPHMPLADVVHDIDGGLAAIVDRALEKSPDARFPGVREFFDALNYWLEAQNSYLSVPKLSQTSALPMDPHSDTEDPTFIGPALGETGGFPVAAERFPSSSPMPATASSEASIKAAQAASEPQPWAAVALGSAAAAVLLLGFVYVRNHQRAQNNHQGAITVTQPAPTTPPQKRPSPLVPLAVRNLPPKAEVFVNGKQTKLPAQVKRGSKVILKVTAPGYLPWKQELMAHGAIEISYSATAAPSATATNAARPPAGTAVRRLPKGVYKPPPY